MQQPSINLMKPASHSRVPLRQSSLMASNPSQDAEIAARDMVVSLNISSLTKRLDEVRHILRCYKFPVLGLSETHIQDTNNRLLTVHNYNCITRPADPRRGRNRGRQRSGMAIFFHQALPADEHELPETNIETIGLMVRLNDGNQLLVIFVYFGQHLKDFPSDDIKLLLGLHPHTVLIGDFNSRHPTWGDQAANKFGTALHNLLDDEPEYILLAPEEYTFSSNHGTHTTIDLALTNYGRLTHIEALELFTSDHRPIAFSLPGKSSVGDLPLRLNLSKADWGVFKDQLDRNIHLPPDVSTPQKLDETVTLFTTTITDALSAACPLTPIGSFHIHFDDATQDLYRAYYRARRIHQHTPSPANYRRCLAAHQAAQDARNALRDAHWKQVLAQADLNTLYRIQRRLKNRGNPYIPPLTTAGGEVVTGMAQKIETIADAMIISPPPLHGSYYHRSS